MTDLIAQALINLFSWPNILFPLFGTLVMMITSFLPGIGGMSVISFLMIATLSWDPVSVLLLFGAITGGATFMGSVSAILFNIPGTSSSAATLIDGFPLAMRGYPKQAIAASATASAVGSVFGVAVLLALLPVMKPLVMQFGALERFLVAIWGLSTIVSIPSKVPLRALAMAFAGLLVAQVGSDIGTGLPRWTFGVNELYDGIGIIPLFIGVFTLSEILAWRGGVHLAKRFGQSGPDDSILSGIIAVFRHFGVTARSSLLGLFVGMLPGVGGTVASFVAYGRTARRADPEGKLFGKGDVRGLIAPESAVDAKDGGSLLPVIALGLPGGEGTVILLSVLALHGISPGLEMLSDKLPLTLTLISSLLFSNILTSVVGLAMIPLFLKIKSVDIRSLYTPAAVVVFLTAMSSGNGNVDIVIMLASGTVSYLLMRAGWPVVPFIIAFTLGKFLESSGTVLLGLMAVGKVHVAERPFAMLFLALILLSAGLGLRRTLRGRPAVKTAPAAPPQAARPRSVAVSVAAFVALAVLAAEPVVTGGRYSTYGVAMLVATALAFAIALVRELFEPAAGGAGPDWAALRENAFGLVAKVFPFVAALGVSVLFGGAAAVGVLVGLSSLGWAKGSARRTILLVAIVLAATLLTAQSFDMLFGVPLPTGLFRLPHLF